MQSQPNNILFDQSKPSLLVSSIRASRREKLVLACLRIGRTHLTNSHILNSYILTTPFCPHYEEENMAVGHFFSCPKLLTLRSPVNISPNLSSSLRNNSDAVTLVIQYLHSTEFVYLIWSHTINCDLDIRSVGAVSGSGRWCCLSLLEVL